jgi:hypothetical protein
VDIAHQASVLEGRGFEPVRHHQVYRDLTNKIFHSLLKRFFTKRPFKVTRYPLNFYKEAL